MRALSAHVKWILQVPRKSIPILRFTGKWVNYSFVLFESTRSIFYSPYSVNVTVTNELLEVYLRTLISAKTLCFMTFFLILSLLPIHEGGYVVYLLNVDTLLYRHESTSYQKHTKLGYLPNVDTSLYRHEST